MTQKEKQDSNLERELNAPLLAIYGAGTILGAGIYVLVGKLAGHAGLWIPAAFAVAAVVAMVNGLVYSELSARVPSAGGPSEYVQEAFSQRWLTVTIGWMIVATGVVSAATITTGFSGYVAHLFDWNEPLIRAALLLGLGTLAAFGAKESAWFMAATTTVGLLGLAFVIWVGFWGAQERTIDGLGAYWRSMPSLGEAGIAVGLFTAGFLAVYSFIGFEDIVHMAEEVKEPSSSIPFAILTATCAAAILYIVVSVAALLVLEPNELADSKAPLVDVVTAAGFSKWPLAVASLWIIMNGALAQIIMATRVIYSLGDRGGAPGRLANVSSKSSTPVLATALCTGAALALALLFPLELLATATSMIMLLVFASSNLALIRLDRRGEAPFDVPAFLPWVGVVLCLAMVVGRFFVEGGGH